MEIVEAAAKISYVSRRRINHN